MSILDFFRKPELLQDLSPDEFEQKLKRDDVIALDTRTHAEYSRGHIEGTKLQPLSTIKSIVGDLEKDRHYVLVCATGHRSRAAAATLIRNGINNVSHLEGGMRSWNRAGKKIVK
ncbi:MAG: rhodanese-like domain-containing protein [Thermoplasmataceae archaeon]